jgi:hypothetical protein
MLFTKSFIIAIFSLILLASVSCHGAQGNATKSCDGVCVVSSSIGKMRMKVWPEFNEWGDLPLGVHSATLAEVVDCFAKTPRRAVAARRLERIYKLALSTGHLGRVIVFGSFITAKTEPNDVDIFLLMDDSFDLMCRRFHQKRLWYLTARRRRIFLERACFGFAARPRSAVKKPLLPIGKLSVTAVNAA